MIGFLKHFTTLYRLGAGLKRYGALAVLYTVEGVPPGLLRFLSIVTFPVPTKTRLPDNAGERMAMAFATMGPAYIKLGQTLATRPDVTSHAIATGLATLQDRLPAFDGKKAAAAIERELGGAISDHFSSFDEKAIAAASIAQVHKAVTKDGTKVAVKVLRPDIEKRFGRDLALFDWLAGIGERYSAEGRRLKLRSIAETVRSTVSREMDLRLEAAGASELKDNMLGEVGYRVPQIDWDRSGRSVMTLEWVDGISLTKRDQLRESGIDLKAVSHRLVTVFLQQALRDGYFHADLHQGNFILEPDGTIAAIDFGIMGRLGKKERFFLAESLFGMILRDYRRVAEVHFDVGYVPRHHDIDEFAAALRAIADPILDKPIEEISAGKLLAQLFATTERFGMQTRPELLLLQRAMVMAEGLALHLDSHANMWEIARPTLTQWARENLSPEVRLAETLRKLPRLFMRLLPHLEQIADDTNAYADGLDAGVAGSNRVANDNAPANGDGLSFATKLFVGGMGLFIGSLGVAIIVAALTGHL